MAFGIIIKNFAHFNRALPNWDSPKGKWIKNKDHYDSEMKKAGMIPYEEAQQKEKDHAKPYLLSKKAQEIINSAKNSKKKDGTVKLSGKTISAMQEIGAINKKIPHYMSLPSHYQTKGGFL